MLTCMYCQKTDEEMYQVREATKPWATPFRWRIVGYCCEACYELGRPLEIDKSNAVEAK